MLALLICVCTGFEINFGNFCPLRNVKNPGEIFRICQFLFKKIKFDQNSIVKISSKISVGSEKK